MKAKAEINDMENVEIELEAETEAEEQRLYYIEYFNDDWKITTVYDKESKTLTLTFH